ncbi:MAG TPA: malto-oligosyltrehalose synthase, partial [Myxococcota bacterium]
TSTHDTKWSADARVRLALLAELAPEWSALVDRLSSLAARHQSDLVDKSSELLLYHALVACAPASAERVVAYLHKAAREAKLITSWAAPNEPYESALASFARALLADPRWHEITAPFFAQLVPHARTTSLALALLQLTSPGVPDIYQGCDLFCDAFVDPDNRRPVDFARRASLLRDGDGALARFRDDVDGAAKQALIRAALAVRAHRPASFAPGAAYTPLLPTGAQRAHAIAYQRGDDVIAIAPRLVVGLARAGGFGDTRLALPPGTWRNALASSSSSSPSSPSSHASSVLLASLWASAPVALLVRDDARGDR